jgi:hypothetical protein
MNNKNLNKINRPWVISGSPRSGTTWLAEIISASVQNPRMIWEPFHCKNPELKNYNFSHRPYIKESDKKDTNIEFFQKLLKGDMLNLTTLKINATPKFFYKKGVGSLHNVLYSIFGNGQLIIKFVRGNGTLEFLYDTFNIPKPVVIIRHPCAVIASQQRSGWDDYPHIDEKLLEQYPHIKEVLARTNNSQIKKKAITWACDTLYAKLCSEKINIIYYEDLVLEGERTLEKIFSEWGFDKVPESCLEQLNILSSTSAPWTVKKSGMKKLESWANYLSPDEVEDIFEILHEIGIDDYNKESFLPVYGESKYEMMF